MAQSISDIQNEMIAEKANHPELTALDSTSNTSIWQLWTYITATVIMYFEQLMDLFKTDIQNIIDTNQYGSAAWWYNQILAFQYGDLLVFINNIFQYPPLPQSPSQADLDNLAAKQIIKFCSVSTSEDDGVIQIKVAKADGNGQPAQLSEDEKNGVYSYCKAIRPAGIRFTVISKPADVLQLGATIYYDSAGDLSVIQPAVEQAIATFLATNNASNVDGTLYVNKLIDAIQAVPGLVGNQVDIKTLIAVSGSGANIVTTPVTSSYQPVSGYIMLDATYHASYPFTYSPIPALPPSN